jgi:hypothetical protein
MSAHILRLEGHLEELPPGRLQSLVSTNVRAAMVLRDLLVRVSYMPQPRAVADFYERLSKATLCTFRWAVVHVAEVRHLFGARELTGVRAIPLGALSAFHDLSELCASSDDAEAPHLVTLQAINDTLFRLIETRDRIERQILIGYCAAR